MNASTSLAFAIISGLVAGATAVTQEINRREQHLEKRHEAFLKNEEKPIVITLSEHTPLNVDYHKKALVSPWDSEVWLS